MEGIETRYCISIKVIQLLISQTKLLPTIFNIITKINS
jgi:hypothetical protein